MACAIAMVAASPAVAQQATGTPAVTAPSQPATTGSVSAPSTGTPTATPAEPATASEPLGTFDGSHDCEPARWSGKTPVS
ncbi:MAG: hypothetical protein C0606_15570 [Hyphomicrobiales bacterium]|nr:MAG: hypothetical protein C0606_15570 [Hyphomicrobiales bacterium]